MSTADRSDDGSRSVSSSEVGPSPEAVRAAASKLGIGTGQYLAHLKLLSPSAAASEVERVLHPTAAAAPGETVIYGRNSDQPVFALESDALKGALVTDAWWNSRTWGEFRQRAAQAGMPEVLEAVDDDDPRPDDAPITEEERNYYTGDCDWPVMGAYGDPCEWMPEEVRALGDAGVSMTTGPGLWFDDYEDPDLMSRVVAALESFGFICRRDDDLLEAYDAVVRGRGHFRNLSVVEIEQLRTEASQYPAANLAREAGVSPHTVKRFTSGEGNVRRETLDSLRWGLTRLRPTGPAHWRKRRTTPSSPEDEAADVAPPPSSDNRDGHITKGERPNRQLGGWRWA